MYTKNISNYVYVCIIVKYIEFLFELLCCMPRGVVLGSISISSALCVRYQCQGKLSLFLYVKVVLYSTPSTIIFLLFLYSFYLYWDIKENKILVYLFSETLKKILCVDFPFYRGQKWLKKSFLLEIINYVNFIFISYLCAPNWMISSWLLSFFLSFDNNGRMMVWFEATRPKVQKFCEKCLFIHRLKIQYSI